MITASQLYNHVSCPHRVSLDLHGNPADRDPTSPFIKLLWERGSLYEQQVVAALQPDRYLSLRDETPEERQAATLEAMRSGVKLIYGGRISAGNLLGEPDLLIARGGGYIAADTKSGRGEEGDADEGDGKPKAHYAVQVALYTDILEQLGFSIGHIAEIWDSRGDKVVYDLDLPRHTKTTETWWDLYKAALASVSAATGGTLQTRPALSSQCKLCDWCSHCKAELQASKDLTLIPHLGRAIRDAMCSHIENVEVFAEADPELYIVGKKTTIPGLGPDRLRAFHRRARILTEEGAQPFLKQVVELPATELEIFFDIEADSMTDIVYLHGFLERWNGDPATEKFTYFFAEANTLEAEREAFAQAMAWLLERRNAAVYYYSKYERTMYRKLCQRHDGVCLSDDIEQLFTRPRSVDLYFDVVLSSTEWPTNDHSIKTLAKYLGFAWRDADPSGAASIEWYQRWVQTGDPAIWQRIIDYNEDDCRATAVLLDGIRNLAVAD